MKKGIINFRDAKPLAQAVGLCFFVVFGFIFATGAQMLFPPMDVTPSAVRWTLIKNMVAQILMFLLPAVVFGIVYHSSFASYFKLGLPKGKWMLPFVAIAIMLLLTPVNDWITYWNEGLDLGSSGDEFRRMSNESKKIVDLMLSLNGGWDLALQLFVVALVPAVCEELFFRGCFQQVMQKWTKNAHAAIVVTAVLFSLAHGDVFGFVPRLVLGLLLGYFFYLSGSILVNICAHFFNNALIVVLYYLYHNGILLSAPDSPLMMPWLTTCLCTLAAIALFVIYFAKPQKND